MKELCKELSWKIGSQTFQGPTWASQTLTAIPLISGEFQLSSLSGLNGSSVISRSGCFSRCVTTSTRLLNDQSLQSLSCSLFFLFVDGGDPLVLGQTIWLQTPSSLTHTYNPFNWPAAFTHCRSKHTHTNLALPDTHFNSLVAVYGSHILMHLCVMNEANTPHRQ